MVVSAIVHYYKPASRGLLRRANGSARQQSTSSLSIRNLNDAPNHYDSHTSSSSSSNNTDVNHMDGPTAYGFGPINEGDSDGRSASRRWSSLRAAGLLASQSDRLASTRNSLRPADSSGPYQPAPDGNPHAQHEQNNDNAASAQHNGMYEKRKKFKAISILTSAAADFDVVADWLYFYESSKQENDGGEQLVPNYLLTLLLVSCIFGTLSWLVLATDGRIVAPVLKWLNVEGISTGYVLLFTVLVEDIPQVVLTFLIDDYYENDEVSSFAMFNLCTSLYDTMIKIAEAYDERFDVVETGAWCKETYRGHHDCVTKVVPLPLSTAKYPDGVPLSELTDEIDGGCANGGCTNIKLGSSRSRTEAKDISPHFLTCSYDGTVRLWDPSSNHRLGRTYIRKFKCQKDWVTSIITLGENIDIPYIPPANVLSGGKSNEADDISLKSTKTTNTVIDLEDEKESNGDVNFIVGCRDGSIKLYTTSDNRLCLREYTRPARAGPRSAVTCLASLDRVSGSKFVSGHADASALLWDTITGENLRVFRGHEQLVTSVCNFHDGSIFLTGSDDGLIKAWDMVSTCSMQGSMELPNILSSGTLSMGSFGESKKCNGLVAWDVKHPGELSDEVAPCERDCVQVFKGHRGSVFCLATIEEGELVMSGSTDRRVKIWDASGKCVRDLVGHTGAVTSVCVFDETTVLSGSLDQTARMWDIDSGVCLRVFEHHKAPLTCVAACGNGRTFLTTSRDHTIKLWTATNATTMKQLMQGTEVEESMEYA